MQFISVKTVLVCERTKFVYHQTRNCFRLISSVFLSGIAYFFLSTPSDKSVFTFHCWHTYMQMGLSSTKTTKSPVRPAWTQISLGIRLGSLADRKANSEDWSDKSDSKTDLSLHWAHKLLFGFVMLRQISYDKREEGSWNISCYINLFQKNKGTTIL